MAFRPELKRPRFQALLRKFVFYSNFAVYRDARRKLELMVDQAAMPIISDQTWNQWKHLLAAKKTFHRFGQYSRAIEQLRARIERKPVEKPELERLLAQLGVPSDFDVARITWRPDYDPFFYKQLAKRACRLFLFRDEYIFETPEGLAVETPKLGHATYLFAKLAGMEGFLTLYARVTKEDIRLNRDNVAARLGFLGRIVHGANPKAWINELDAKLGNPSDLAGIVT